MLLSILIPVYNERAVAEKSLRLVLAAPVPETVERELVVVDDCSTDGTLEDNGRITERAECHGNGNSSNGIVHDLLPDEDLNGIRARVAANLKVNNRLIWFEPGICLIDSDKPGSIKRRNPVFRGSPRKNLIIMDTMFAKVGLEFSRSELRGRFRHLHSPPRACAGSVDHGNGDIDRQDEVILGFSEPPGGGYV